MKNPQLTNEIGNKAKMSARPTFIQHFTGGLSAVRQGKEIKDMVIGKEEIQTFSNSVDYVCRKS